MQPFGPTPGSENYRHPSKSLLSSEKRTALLSPSVSSSSFSAQEQPKISERLDNVGRFPPFSGNTMTMGHWAWYSFGRIMKLKRKVTANPCMQWPGAFSFASRI
jgi:hypothetical protein